MKRRIIAMGLLVGVISGCISTNNEAENGGMRPNYGHVSGPPSVPGVKGAYGENFPMTGPYRPGSDAAALGMMNANVPMNAIQMHPNGGMTPPNMPPFPGMNPGSGLPGMPGGMGGMPMMPGGMGMPPGAGNPFQRTGMNSFMPGGVINANVPPGGAGAAGVVPAQYGNAPIGPMFPAQRTQVFFPKPAGMKIHWFTTGQDGKPAYSATPLETPVRYNFAQGAIYRLKLTHIPGRPGLELYPTLEVVPTSPKTNEFLAHNSVPLEFAEEDFKQVVDRNYIVKVIYLPDPQFQDAAGAGPDEIVSTRLEPGQDPIQEALRRGSILLVLRIGNIDQGLQHSPAMTAPIPGGPPAFTKPANQGVSPFFQRPFPIDPITPGAVNPNPPLPFPGTGNAPPVIAPPVVKPEVVKPEVLKPEVVPPKKKEEGKVIAPPVVAPPVIAPPVGLKPDVNVRPELPLLPTNEKPFVPPIPIPTPKGANTVTPRPELPLLPVSTSKDGLPELPSPSAPPAPLLPMSGPSTSARPELPLLPPNSGPR